jgi:phage/plasmid-like protein (TIGR03299 family)
MSHEIDFSTGTAGMAYVGARPWHGLGQLLQPGASLDTWIKAARLDWTALKLPSLYEMPEGHRLAGRPIVSPNYHIVRSDNGASLGVMSDRYQPVQPSEVMTFFRDFILTDPRFQLETAGALKGGGVIWALARFEGDIMAGGDRHAAYVLLTTSYNGTLATTAQATMVRVVCNNTLTASIYGRGTAATVKVPHSRKWTDAVQRDAHERLEEVARGFSRYSALADALRVARMTKDQTEALFRSLVFRGDDATKDASTKSKNAFDALFASYVTTANETEPGTGWTALNAVTRYVDHDRSTRRTGGVSDSDARMASSFYGSGARLKAEAIDRLVDTLDVQVTADGTYQTVARQTIAPVPAPVTAEASHDFASLMAAPASRLN